MRSWVATVRVPRLAPDLAVPLALREIVAIRLRAADRA